MARPLALVLAVLLCGLLAEGSENAQKPIILAILADDCKAGRTSGQDE